jgi:hypothetical protein
VSFEYRDAWLDAAAEHFKPDFEAYGYPLPERLRVTCGWPSKGALALKARRIGECWEPKASADRTVEIFIVRDHRVPPSAMLCLPEIAFVSIQMYFLLDRARRFSL